MIKTSEIVIIEIIKHLPGQHLQETHAGEEDGGSALHLGELPEGVKPTVTGIRADIRKTLSKKVDLTKKIVEGYEMVPGTSYAAGKTRHTTGVKIHVSEIKSGFSVFIQGLGNEAKSAYDALIGRGYKIPSGGEKYNVLSFDIDYKP